VSRLYSAFCVKAEVLLAEVRHLCLQPAVVRATPPQPERPLLSVFDRRRRRRGRRRRGRGWGGGGHQ